MRERRLTCLDHPVRRQEVNRVKAWEVVIALLGLGGRGRRRPNLQSLAPDAVSLQDFSHALHLSLWATLFSTFRAGVLALGSPGQALRPSCDA